jgi:anti-anti-sigma regulatory factor
MLKITSRTDAPWTIFELEGKLAGPWVRELEDCWRTAASSERSVRVMLCAVTFIDDKGIALLAQMYQHGAELVAEGCMNKAIVEEIARGGQPWVSTSRK